MVSIFVIVCHASVQKQDRHQVSKKHQKILRPHLTAEIPVGGMGNSNPEK